MRINPNAGIELGPGFLEQRPTEAALIAQCIATWIEVELQHSRLLAQLLHANTEPAAAVYLSLKTASNRRELLAAAAKATLSAQELELFFAIQNIGKGVETERNHLAHGIFGISSAIPESVVWVDPQHRIQNIIQTTLASEKNISSGGGSREFTAIIQKTMNELKENIFVYRRTDLQGIYEIISQYQKLVYQFISLISRDHPALREELFHQLCEIPRVQAELRRMRASQQTIHEAPRE